MVVPAQLSLIFHSGGFDSATARWVNECAWWIPEYECVWLSRVKWKCWVKKWHCIPRWVRWTHQPTGR
jgi:hypothetical protein